MNETILTLGQFILGLICLLKGGDLLVAGASHIARRLGISALMVGMIVVGFGTSAPELLVSINAALDGVPEIAVGNVFGSNVANILLILGAAATITTLAIPVARVWRDLLVMVLSLPLLWWVMRDGVVTRPEGAVLCVALICFVLSAFCRPNTADTPADETEQSVMPFPKALFLTVFGIGLLVVGARFLVDSASEIATVLGISKAVIGLTVVAIGTSLPELATGVIAALRKQTDIVVGNVIGSNIFNIFSILGITAVVTPIPVEARFLRVDFPWVVGASLVLVLLALTLRRVPRLVGVCLLGFYGLYVALALA